MDDSWRLEEDLLLSGSLLVVVLRRDGRPRRRAKVVVRGNGINRGATQALTGRDGSVALEAPPGRVEICVGNTRRDAWIGVDLRTVVKIVC